MALIADCNASVAALTDGWITSEGSVNQPMQKKMVLNDTAGEQGEGTYMHPVFAQASFKVDVISTGVIIQRAVGLDEVNSQHSQSITTEYERVSAVGLGHVVGTDWTEWTKVGH